MMKKLTQTAFLTLLVCGMALAPAGLAPLTKAAEFYNFGTLDVRPVHNGETTNQDWFIEYLERGTQKQHAIQVSNFSSQPKELVVYGTDTSLNEGKSFFTKTLHETSDDVADWIQLPTQKITLQPSESRVLSVNFTIPKNAGVGLHTGAIIVRENRSNPTDNSQSFASEKGVRVYMNIVGSMLENGYTQAVKSAQTSTQYQLNVTTANQGTVDYKTTYELRLRDLFGELHATASAPSRTEPQTTTTTILSLEKPAFGLYNLYLSNQKGDAAYAGTVLFLPFWLPVIMLFMVSMAVRPQHLTKTALQNLFKNPEFKKGFAYFGLVIMMTGSSLAYHAQQFSTAQAQIARGQSAPQNLAAKDKAADEYILTVKWGELRHVRVPGNQEKEWHGSISVNNGRLTIAELLNFERSDQAEVTGNKASVQYDVVTGPDNDGLMLSIIPTGSSVPSITYTNDGTDEQFEMLITDILKAPLTYPQGLWGVRFEAQYTEQEIARRNVLNVEALEEISATEEREATPQRFAQIPELENLFIQEIPATRERLSDFILSSDYVEEVTREDSTNQLRVDSILLKALEATPEVLSEITATPDLNFLFIPTEEISFPPQEFSFNENKDSEQSLGTLIFVQNTRSSWNTFVGTTDFELLSGDHTIPASALTVIPGEISVLTEDGEREVNPGEEKRITGRTDRTSLVNSDASGGQKKAFVMNPRLRVQIPGGTPAGTYRGELTITSL